MNTEDQTERIQQLETQLTSLKLTTSATDMALLKSQEEMQEVTATLLTCQQETSELVDTLLKSQQEIQQLTDTLLTTQQELKDKSEQHSQDKRRFDALSVKAYQKIKVRFSPSNVD
jgi:hypothetical protein